ncbi:sodium/potassium-transporting ATPase subunit alpha-like, partial [Actinia tenebrosa]|uniref:Sodium/potassium-transporting ATPase subunit alpha-like n=1 Tax=Actinia tenebrosa TaxID=6105 RepID=A0A6P8HIA1_ACTTE
MAETTEIALENIEVKENAESEADGEATENVETEANRATSSGPAEKWQTEATIKGKQPTKMKEGKSKNKDLDDLKQELEMEWHTIALEEAMARLETSAVTGLTQAEAERRLERDGPNCLTPPRTVPEWVKFCRLLFGGFSMLLWIGSILCFITYSIKASTEEEPSKDD